MGKPHGYEHPCIVKPVPERALPVYTIEEPAVVSADRVVAAVAAPPVEPGNLEALLRRYPRIWNFCWSAYCQVRRDRHRHRYLRLGLREWKPCCNACFRKRRFRPRGRDRFPLTETGLLMWQTGPWGGQVPGTG